MKANRTVNSILNFSTSIVGQLLTILLEFIVRSVFILKLGKTMLGLNGLFSNVLTMLSLAELGVGTAIIFQLYEPISKNNYRRISALMHFYKKAYAIIGLIIIACGLAFIPFLPNIIDDYEKYASSLNVNIIYIYLLFLLRTSSTYFFLAYKSAIIRANQKEYILNLVNYCTVILTAVLRIIALYIFPRFDVYLIISIVLLILQNIFYAYLANRLYPYINEYKNERLEKREIKEIFKDCGALLIYKINNVVLKGTDNIIISGFLGLQTLGQYTNYYLFYRTINTLFEKAFGSIAHSLGNLHTTKEVDKEYSVFCCTHLIAAILGSVTFTGVALIGDSFIRSWLGNDWVFDWKVSLLIGLETYTMAYRKMLNSYRSSMGLFQQAKWRPLFGMIINLVVSLILVRFWGVCGVLAGTIVADWTTFMWFDPMIIHKYGFKSPERLKSYFLKYLKYFLTTIAVLVLDRWLLSNIIPNHGWFTVIVHALICGITAPAAILAVSWNTDERKYVTGLADRIFGKIANKIRHK